MELMMREFCLVDDMHMAMRRPLACSFPRSDHLTTEFSRDARDFGYIVDAIWQTSNISISEHTIS